MYTVMEEIIHDTFVFRLGALWWLGALPFTAFGQLDDLSFLGVSFRFDSGYLGELVFSVCHSNTIMSRIARGVL
jgi:hypothetical protein